MGAMTVGPAVTPEHVVVVSHDGVVTCLNLQDGTTLWMKSMGEAIHTEPWVLGGMVTEDVSTGVEGAAPIKVSTYKGLAFARNVGGLCCFDLTTGAAQFKDRRGGKPLCRQGKWILTGAFSKPAGWMVSLRDSTDGYQVKGTLSLGMFDLLPTNSIDGTLYGVRADGNIVAAVPR